ncbi:GspH/FimT family pseudopilin [Desmospora profundinema]|uniref:Tfp pilus assembly protein FimT n=1 Tax=Desmospora profundinema TaxID=1571184 RepID=A0ABU1IJI9_9BACL|nr:GspH/FimT family pseudopilin [Desmospora profundinema]MDR6224940.1 Tfp pilus assembly protein FimT [Desmospora profundinema]
MYGNETKTVTSTRELAKRMDQTHPSAPGRWKKRTGPGWIGWRDEGGWNLVELQVTLLLISLLAGLCYPAFVQWADRVERDLFLGVLASDIRMAQREATVREEEVVLALDSEAGIYRIMRDGQVIRQGKMPSRFQVESNYPGDRILFRRTGQVRGGTLSLRSGGELVGKVIIQVASGRPRVETGP